MVVEPSDKFYNITLMNFGIVDRYRALKKRDFSDPENDVLFLFHIQPIRFHPDSWCLWTDGVNRWYVYNSNGVVTDDDFPIKDFEIDYFPTVKVEVLGMLRSGKFPGNLSE